MKKQIFGLVGLATLAATGSALAAEGLPAPGKLTVGSNVKVSVLVDTYYQANLIHPPVSPAGSTTADPVNDPQVAGRSYDRSDRQFSLSTATVGLSHDLNPVGFDLRMGFGTQLEVLNSSNSTYRHVRNATVGYKSGSFTFTAGRFDADFGFEKIDSVDNWNYSRSLSYTYLDPKFFTGAKMAYDLGGGLSFAAGITTGIDLYSDNNRSMTYVGQLNYKGGDLSFAVNYVVGQENSFSAAGTQAAWRHTLGLNAKYSLSSSLDLGADLTWVHGKEDTVATGVTKAANRLGVDLYGSVSLLDKHWDTLRVEFLQDRDGAVYLQNRAVRTLGFTLTHRWLLTRNFSLWAEARWDMSSQPTFLNVNGTSNQKTDQTSGLLAATFNI